VKVTQTGHTAMKMGSTNRTSNSIN